jgi:hypothetical protein
MIDLKINELNINIVYDRTLLQFDLYKRPHLKLNLNIGHTI